MDGRVFSRIFLIFVFITCISALSSKGKFNRRRLVINGRPWHGLKPSKYHGDPHFQATNGTPQVQWFYQKVDHFDTNNNDKYWQRYWYNAEFYQPGGPAFIMIGGESAETAWWVEDETIQWLKWAKQHNAITFLLEHRFYGSSQPKNGDMSAESLKFLSSEQAIEDVVNFIQGMNSKFNLTTSKWIAFGGSYSGALAAWSRMLHPDVIYGAVASSAPVQPVVDFTGYLELIAADLSNYNPACAESLHNGLVAANNLIRNPAGRQQLFKGFKLCEYIDYADEEQISYFFLELVGLYMTVVQYSGDNVLNYNKDVNIPSICAYHLQKGKSDLEKLQEVNAFFMSFYQESCLYIDYEDYIQFLIQPGDDKAWVYQTCSEFGYYQSTTSTKASQFFGNVLPVDWFIRQCELVYGPQFANISVYHNVDKTNSIYQGKNGYNGTRVVLPNGTNDPWHLPAILTSPNNQSYAIVIQGTSHVADIYPDAPNDSDALKQARIQIAQHLSDWLKN